MSLRPVVMSTLKTRLTLFLLAFVFESSASAEGVLRVLIPESSAMPFGKFVRVGDTSIVHSGLEKDWGDAMARQMGRVAEFAPIPAKRVTSTAAKGGFDLQCFQSPQWYGPEHAKVYEWFSRPLLAIEERLVGAAEAKQVRSPRDIMGKRIGVVLGYRYPELDPLFEANSIVREEAPNEVSLLQKQLKGRADFSVVKTINLAYAQQQDRAFRSLRESEWVVSRTELYCMRVLASGVSLAEMSDAHQVLVANGTLKRILASYR